MSTTWSVSTKGTEAMDFESTLHLIMFVVAFGVMYVGFTSD